MAKFCDARRAVATSLVWVVLMMATLFGEPAAQSSGSIWIRHSGFEGLKGGSAGDSGANLYLSARGRLQTVNRWDLNRDGELDLFFTQDHNSVYTPDSLIYWGSNDGFQSLLPEMWRLRAPFSLLSYVEQASRRITRLPTAGGGRCQIADLNGDGYPDIVFANFMHNFRTDQPAYIYWGSAQGFTNEKRTELPAYLASGVAVGDLNGDALPEVVLANHGDESGEHWGFGHHLESYIYWGNLNGYDVARRTSIPTISAADVAIGDFNGDRAPDLAFVNYNSQEQSVYLYWGDGQGGFSEQRRQALRRADLRLSATKRGQFGWLTGMKTLLAAHLDKDRFSDLVVAGTNTAVIFHGTENGLDAGAAAELPAQNCQGMEASDLNRDGYVDLVLANEGAYQQAPPASVIYWGANLGFSADLRTELPTIGAASVKAADLNQDGFPDLLFGNAHDAESRDVPSQIYWGAANGFAVYRRSDLQGFGTVGCGVADLNGDGKLDILLVSHLSGGSVLPSVIFWGNQDHHYSNASVSLLEPGGDMEHSVADLDDDGHADIVLMLERKAFVWWGSQAGYAKESRSELPVQSPMSHCVADLNRDGYLDIVFGIPAAAGEKRARGIIVWGNAARFKQARTDTIELSGPGIESNAVADVNKDGYLDLIFPVANSAYSEIWWGSQTGYAPSKVTKLEANGAPHAVVADLDRDGWLDVVFTAGLDANKRSVNSLAFIYWGSAEGFSTAARTGVEGFTTLDATVADFNRDGHLDIALTNYKSDTTRDLPAMIYWGDGGRNFSAKRRTLLDAKSSSAIDALDLNRDGWVDLVVSNHQIDFDHAAGTNIYWGSEKGYSRSNRTHLPTIGVHLDAMVDAGNIYHRKYEWDYLSAPLEAPQGTAFARLEWKAETKLGTGVKFQVRSATTRAGLENAGWSGPEGAASYYTQSGAALVGVGRDQRWLQYRAVLTSPDGGNSALLSEVALECKK